MSPPRVKISDCSYQHLVRVAQRCGFVIVEGGKHCKVKLPTGDFITTIPRHARLKRETVRGIVKQFNEFGGKIKIS